MKFYLPNFEDLVDPKYNFLTEENSPERTNRLLHDWGAHCFYEEPIFDGVLMSKTIVTRRVDALIRNAQGVHNYLRLSPNIPVMGDCGAFSYRDKDQPPYAVDQILPYYEELGFTQGVSIDHLIFSSMEQRVREYRLQITLDNARAFLAQHKEQACTFTPIGIIQGWDAASRRDVARQLLEMGYQHLALGGMVRSNNAQIVETLQAIHPLICDQEITLHVFGVARLGLVPDFMRLGVTSADSTAPLRRAFLGTNSDNYWTRDGQKYAAIRVPGTKKRVARRRGVDSTDEVLEKNHLQIEQLKQMEQQTLNSLRRYDAGDATLEDTLETVLAYDRLHGKKRQHEKPYRRTLEEQPWKQCGCAICEAIGIEVIIFRGNNRNRRRGFHNVKAFYEQLLNQVTMRWRDLNRKEVRDGAC